MEGLLIFNIMNIFIIFKLKTCFQFTDFKIKFT